MKRVFLPVSPFVFIVGWAIGGAGAITWAAEPEVSFNRDIRPILSENCFRCHGPDEKHREGELRLDVEAGALALRDGKPAIKPGDLKASALWQRITSTNADELMPPANSNKHLTKSQIETIRRWIEQGAKYQGHWAFIPPKTPATPGVKLAPWVKTPIDAFLLAEIERAGLRPSPEAPREILLRRLSLDLTGLPPSPADRLAFLSDESPQAYEKLVDRLLASPHYGERMALGWMDAARYGDSSVFHADGPRDMWAWRDWVIKSYNANLPFDRFTVDQLAGDLLPSATVDQRVASGFNRNNGTTDEGGAIAEEYRVEYAVDRVKTTATVWLGLTMECGQCHDHKYDPISQKEYYQFFAFFNSAADPGMQTRGGNAAPMVSIPHLENEAKAEGLRRQLAELEGKLKSHVAASGPEFERWLTEAAGKIDKTSPVPMDVAAYFPLDEAKGTQIADAVEGKRLGTIHGKPQFAAGKFGQALKCDGNNYVDLGDVGDFERTAAFSYGAWVFTEGNGAGAPIARMDDAGAHRGYDLFLHGNASVHLIHHWPDNAIKVTTKKSFPPGQWHHYFVTYDGSSKAAGVKIYVDGKPEEWNIEQNALSDTIRTAKPLYLGRRNPGSPFKGLVDDVRVYPRELSAAEAASLAGADPIAPLLAIPAPERTKEQTETLRTHFLARIDPLHKQMTGEIAKAKTQIDELAKPLTTVMIMQDLPQMRKTYLLDRGDYASPRKNEEILPGTPAFLPGMPEGAPRNRLGLAQWLVQPGHPLTGRMAVNRMWQMFFGAGLVTTAEDFGSQGGWPSHPELLDWLAVDFQSHGWDVKRFVKQIVMSAAYRQSSKLSPELAERDPANRLLARGPRFRLQGELVRDNALALSGLFAAKIGGPSVKPYQPPGLWAELSMGGPDFAQDHGESLYRRSMYTYWKRSAPAPSMMIFDAPTREKCIIQRQRTNTPLQALVTLNDPQFVEAARAMAQRVMKEGGATPESRAGYAYTLATCRAPRAGTLAVLLATYEKELEKFNADPAKVKALLSVGESPRDASLDPAQHAAWTVISSMILNLDETLTKG